jgi:lipooligosaccharide transport system ATP-binding protein
MGPGKSEPLVKVTDLRKRFGRHEVVKGINLSVSRGECLGLLGPNGAGKTTIINILLGLVTPSSGSIFIFDLKYPEDLRKIKQRIGVVPQLDNLDPDLTVMENLLTYASYFGIKRSIAREKSLGLLEFFALKTRMDDIIQHLSGGMRRRLLIARAIINNPELLILDEPTIGLDPQARHLIWDRLSELKGQGITILLTSHYMEEVARLSDRVMIMDSGMVSAEGHPRELVRDIVGVDVYEVLNESQNLDEVEKRLRECKANFDKFHEKIIIYVREPCAELDALALSCPHVIKRPANLEDLFLKLSGRSLKEE